MKKLIVIILLITSGYAFQAFPAEGPEWLNMEIDFGIINETDGKREGEFRFINTGKKPLVISEVQTSCGCTQAEYTHGKIQKGDTAVIKVSYDPYERPGKFDKGVYVFIDGRDIPVNLRMKGTVIASPETLELFYPYSCGSLNLDEVNVDFGTIERGRRRREFIDIYNSGRIPVKPAFEADSDAITWNFEPSEINPGENGTLTIYIDTARITWLGDKEFKIRVTGNESESQDIKVKAKLLPTSHPE